LVAAVFRTHFKATRFSDLSVTHQLAQLVAAIADEDPKQAAGMREYNETKQPLG
jgi:hypothetical protein